MVFGSLALFFFLLSILIYFYFTKIVEDLNGKIKQERSESTRRLYEVAILKELGERVGYSLNTDEIMRIITGSLRQFIDYSVVSYAVINPENIKINIHMEKSVDSGFLKEIKKRMMDSLSTLSDRPLDTTKVEEVVTGAIVFDDLPQPVGSFFNIPFVVAGQLAGVLTIAHTESGLYKEEDMTILYKITSQASEAVTRLQDVVRVEQGKLNAMVESMGDGVLMVDHEYRMIVVNPAVRKIVDMKEGLNLSIFDFVEKLSGKFDIHGRLEEAMVKNTPFISEKIQIKDAFYEIGVYPVATEDIKKNARNLGAVVVFHDISRDIELQKVKEEFTSMIVHELRSPLDGIRKIIELVISGKIKKSSKEFGEYLAMVHQSSSSMLELVSGILDLSKLQAGKFEVEKQKSNIKDLIENRITFYKVSADTKKISIKSLFSENIPAISEFDPQALKQILNNFISNSLKFTNTKGIITITTFLLEPNQSYPKDIEAKLKKLAAIPDTKKLEIKSPSIAVFVSDTGTGIPEKAISSLFQTYSQVKIGERSEEKKGTGLGLSIAKGIAEAHGGRVGAVSKEGVGSTFYFTIPV